MADVDAVIGHHSDPFASGVSRFNEMLATRLGVPFTVLGDPGADAYRRPLFSFKVAELEPADAERFAALLDAAEGVRAFLHAYDGLPLERALVERADVVYCGNAEIVAQLAGIAGDKTVSLWAPGLIADRRPLPGDALRVFSFGMAHKVRADMFARLRDLLEQTGRPYAVAMSNANHATATVREAEELHARMREVFSHDFFFLGNLSDVAISAELRAATFFASFFPRGARANNTSLLSAMEHGSVVITNLDEHSPASFVHMENVVDIERAGELPLDGATLDRLREGARETARAMSWDALVGAIRGSSPPAGG